MAVFDISALDSPESLGAGSNGPSNSVISLSDTLGVVAWRDSDSDGKVQAFSLNRSTGAITLLDSAVEFETDNADHIVLEKIDSTHFILFWSNSSDQATYARIFVVAAGVITGLGSDVTIDNEQSAGVDCVLLDSTHILIAWGNLQQDETIAQVASLDTSTGAITLLGSELTIEASIYSTSISLGLISSEKVIMFYQDTRTTADGFAVVLDINNTTWAVTLAGSKFEFDTSNAYLNNCVVLSTGSTPYIINSYYDTAQKIRSFQVNTSTWAITGYGSETAVSVSGATNAKSNRCIVKYDDTRFILFLTGDTSDGYAITFEFDESDGSITELDVLEFDTANGTGNSTGDFNSTDSAIYVNAWKSTTNVQIQAFDIIRDIKVSQSDSISLSDSGVANRGLTASVSDSIDMTDSISSDEDILWSNLPKPTSTWVNENK